MTDEPATITGYKEQTCCLCDKSITEAYVRSGGIVQRLALGAVAHRRCFTDRYYDPVKQRGEREEQATFDIGGER